MKGQVRTRKLPGWKPTRQTAGARSEQKQRSRARTCQLMLLQRGRQVPLRARHSARVMRILAHRPAHAAPPARPDTPGHYGITRFILHCDSRRSVATCQRRERSQRTRVVLEPAGRPVYAAPPARPDSLSVCERSVFLAKACCHSSELRMESVLPAGCTTPKNHVLAADRTLARRC